MRFGFRHLLFAVILLITSAVSVHAVDEIQVYNAAIAKGWAVDDSAASQQCLS